MKRILLIKIGLLICWIGIGLHSLITNSVSVMHFVVCWLFAMTLMGFDICDGIKDLKRGRR